MTSTTSGAPTPPTPAGAPAIGSGPKAPRPDAIVIGAGPGGLAAAGAMRVRGLRAVVLDRADDVGSAWRRHYDRLHLHTPASLSGLPGLRIPKEYGRWVARDDVVRYLEAYRRHHDIDVRTGASVTRIERDEAATGWRVTCADGRVFEAPAVVVATGYNNTPVAAAYPGIETFTGQVVHTSDYRNASPYVGRDVLVVGAGNTGCEICVDLVEAGARRVRLSYRTIPHILRRSTGPVSAQHTGILIRHVPTRVADAVAAVNARLTIPDLGAYGLPRPDTGLLTRITRDGAIPVQDVGIVQAIRDGHVEPVRALTGFEGDAVLLADGTRLHPEVVIVATGYVQGLEPLVGHLGVLGGNGRPRVHGGHTDPSAPGLYFTGFTNPVSGMFRELAIDARRIAHAVAYARRVGAGA